VTWATAAAVRGGEFIAVQPLGLDPAARLSTISTEDIMATKKRGSAKRSSAKKRPARKAASRERTKTRASKSTKLKQKARKGLRAARGGIDTVRQAGEKTWEALKSTTAQVVEGVRERI
jgi:hypothetical protein